MTEYNQRIALIIELNGYLDSPLPVGYELRDKAVELLKDQSFAAAAHTSRELYQAGLMASNNYVQGLGCFLLGGSYFAAGHRSGDLDRALEQAVKSAQLFHSHLDERQCHNEAMAWLFIGRLHEEQATINYRDRWHAAIKAYQEAARLLRSGNDPLTEWAEAAERRVTLRFTDWMIARRNAQKLAGVQIPARRPDVPEPKPWPSVPNTLEQGIAKPRLVAPSISVILLVALIAISVLALQIGLLGFAGLGLTFVWEFFPYLNTMIEMAIATLMLVIASTLLVLAISRQLFCRVGKDTFAVYEYPRQNRIWVLDAPGRYWVDLSQAYVAAYLPRRGVLNYFLHDYITPDGAVFSARARGEWMVADAQRAWITLRGRIEPRYLFGIPFPIALKHSADTLMEQSRLLVRDALKEVANDRALRAVFEQPNHDEQFQIIFTRKCEHLGIRFEKIRVEMYSHVK